MAMMPGGCALVCTDSSLSPLLQEILRLGGEGVQSSPQPLAEGSLFSLPSSSWSCKTEGFFGGFHLIARLSGVRGARLAIQMFIQM